MTIRVAINHKTSYLYDKPVTLGPHVFRLRPAVHSRTPIESYSLKISPEKHFINWQQDPFGNHLARVVFPEKASELSIEIDIVADMTVINPFDFFVEEYAEHYPFEYEGSLAKDLAPYLETTEDGPLLEAWIGQIDRSKRSIVEFLVGLNNSLYKSLDYTIRLESGVQSCEETLSRKLGSCRDSGWLLVQILRHLGLAARFVSGYLVQLSSDVESLDGPSGPESDFTDLHAWAEVYVPGAGWIGLDPTSGLFAGEGHIPLACTADPASAAPVTGGYEGSARVKFSFANSVSRIHEDPRVTKPYSEEQWEAINLLGREIDLDLEMEDVRLTMGGEPTFVSIDDMSSSQWNTAADGQEKRLLAGKLIRQLKEDFAPGGMLYFGQGKWYPGEALPRWHLACFWRTDGIPVWRNPELLADENGQYGYTVKDAEVFIFHLANRLGLNGSTILPGFEDPFHYLQQEGMLPPDLDISMLKDPMERRRAAALLEGDPGKTVGFTLPIHWSRRSGAWGSSPWQFRRGMMFLIPGDSPMGLRLPLASLPWAHEELETEAERSLFEDPGPLGDTAGEVARRYSAYQSKGEGETEAFEEHIPHTAICVEPREGSMRVFLPPTAELEHYLDLVASIEDTAAALSIPVILEGYQPPRDRRLVRLPVTPDPGVIEVNIHPSSNWIDLAQNTFTLYEAARLCRLGTEKFMLDGRHTGTGGGNHVTLGGATPSDSPILRRPDLLRSLITYWQHHPALSYLFSGLFIGPTSQAPRVDEARNESLYELEIAFGQIPDGEVPEPWLVDRLLRNLLIDVTGNTHRAEFCIDKLYSPEGEAGRLGLVELRAFEMPPHPRMSLVQMLLLRALVCWFWKTPYEKELVRWGTQLHDKYMLAHYIRADMRDVVDDLIHAGYPFEIEWFDPFIEFRFPHYGSIEAQGIRLDLRMGIEPWHVMGEEASAAGTARYVDSSVERLEVKVNGMSGNRHVVTCNGRRIPLRNTGRQGEMVAGVRYRAWQPPSSLHPKIGIHAPLVFDIVDTWNGRSIGGCTYHVAHPGGRNYEVYPVNAFEAEARRVSRFWNYGHTPGKREIPPEETNPDYPCTLDLRRMPR